MPSRFPVAFRPPAFASWAILFPLGSCAFLTVGRPGGCSTRTPTGFPRSTRARYDRGGCPLYPEAAVSIRMAVTSTIGACRFSTASHAPRCNNPSAGLGITRHHREFTHVHPSGLPRACGSRMERKPLGHNT